MSRYHTECSKSTKQEDTVNKVPKCTQPKLTSKPFCDCNFCVCKDCPDILKLFSITVTENSCDFGPKVGNDSNMNKSESENSEETVNAAASLLESINQNRVCGCEVVARAVVSYTQTNIGLTNVRAATNSDNTTTNNSDKHMQQK